MRTRWALPVMAATAVVAAGLVVLPAQAEDAPDAGRSRDLVAQLRQLLPDDHRARREAVGLREDSAGLSVIDPDDYECSADTPLRSQLLAQLASMTEEQRAGAQTLMQFNVPGLDAAFFPEPANQRFFGADGEYTNELVRTFRHLQRFWDVPSKDIELVPMHGGVVLDTARSARAIRVGLGLSPQDAEAAASMLRDLADQDVYQRGELPIFTANAFTVSYEPGQAPPPGASPTRKIVIGDGVLTVTRQIGFGDVAARNILSHEYGHQVQHSRGLLANPQDTPEESRRFELMADSMGAYFLGHPRGADLSWKRIRKSTELSTFTGDCQFDQPGHHGTPNQRGRASEWGAKLSQAGNRILPSARVVELFDRRLPSIVAPDAPDTITITQAERVTATA